jgi:TolB protein
VSLIGAEPPVRLTTIPGSYGMPRWSPDGTRIAFSAVVNGRPDLFIMNADGSGLSNITHHPSGDAAPSWSPDGLRLAFSSDRDGPFDDIYVVTLETGEVIRVTLQTDWVSNEQPTWSPDGAQIAFSRIGGEEALAPGIHHDRRW